MRVNFSNIRFGLVDLDSDFEPKQWVHLDDAAYHIISRQSLGADKYNKKTARFVVDSFQKQRGQWHHDKRGFHEFGFEKTADNHYVNPFLKSGKPDDLIDPEKLIETSPISLSPFAEKLRIEEVV